VHEPEKKKQNRSKGWQVPTQGKRSKIGEEPRVQSKQRGASSPVLRRERRPEKESPWRKAEKLTVDPPDKGNYLSPGHLRKEPPFMQMSGPSKKTLIEKILAFGLL